MGAMSVMSHCMFVAQLSMFLQWCCPIIHSLYFFSVKREMEHPLKDFLWMEDSCFTPVVVLTWTGQSALLNWSDEGMSATAIVVSVVDCLGKQNIMLCSERWGSLSTTESVE